MNRIINIELKSQISLTKSELSERLLDQIRSYLTLENPKYKDALEHGYSTYGMDEFIFAYTETDEKLICYRGYMGNLIAFLKRNGFQYRLIDHRRRLPDINLAFLGELRGYQERAVGDTLKKDFGVAVAPCGAGKTVIACRIMAERKQPTLVIVHTKELLNQWRNRITQYLGFPLDEIGVIGAGKEKVCSVTTGMVQTLAKRDLGEIRQHFGQIIVDECHHTPCTTFTDVVSSLDCQYMLGLSATPYRRDGLNKLIYVTMGKVGRWMYA
jgi:superfamily II DNA or RNA helicase